MLVCHRESALARLRVGCELPEGVVINDKVYRKLVPILAHGVNSALDFGYGLALDTVLCFFNHLLWQFIPLLFSSLPVNTLTDFQTGLSNTNILNISTQITNTKH